MAMGALGILGFLCGAIGALLTKIIPFLLWLHLNSRPDRLARPAPVPNVRQLQARLGSRGQLRLYQGALLLTLGYCAYPSLLRPAALLWGMWGA